jgi:hypothetical protein
MNWLSRIFTEVFMIFTAPANRLAYFSGVEPKAPQSWTIAKTSAGSSYLRIEKLRNETLVVLCLTTARYEGQQRRTPKMRQVAAAGAAPISDGEFEELAGLRRAQGWGTAIFQPGHPKYERTMARMAELEAKERALALDELGDWRLR